MPLGNTMVPLTRTPEVEMTWRPKPVSAASGTPHAEAMSSAQDSFSLAKSAAVRPAASRFMTSRLNATEAPESHSCPHGVHMPALMAPRWRLQLPALQVLHEVMPKLSPHEPGGQYSHEDAPTLALKFPTAHVRQREALPAP